MLIRCLAETGLMRYFFYWDALFPCFNWIIIPLQMLFFKGVFFILYE